MNERIDKLLKQFHTLFGDREARVWSTAKTPSVSSRTATI